jgi:hypothetical protein
LATDVTKLTRYFSKQVGPDWLNINAMGEGGGEEAVIPSKVAYPTKVLGAVLRKHLKNLEIDEMLRGSVMCKIEESNACCIVKPYDDIFADPLTHSDV